MGGTKMILGNRQYSRSPIPAQKFIWVAEYDDNTHISEFDFETKEPKDFYDIEREKVVKFGVIGDGSQAYFDVANGIFNINNNRIAISYSTENCEYPLTGRTILYNDLIQYKQAEDDAIVSLREGTHGTFNHHVSSFNIGYKKRMDLEGVNINFYNVLTLPFEENAYFQIKISANKDLEGKLIIRNNGKIVDEIYAPLIKNQTGIINWDIK